MSDQSQNEQIVCIKRGSLCAKCLKAAEQNAVEGPEVTPTQAEILKFIILYGDLYGYSPTLDEIAAGYRDLPASRVSVFEHIENLIEKGYVRKQPHKKRSIRIEGWVEHAVREFMKGQSATAGG